MAVFKLLNARVFCGKNEERHFKCVKNDAKLSMNYAKGTKKMKTIGNEKTLEEKSPLLFCKTTYIQ